MKTNVHWSINVRGYELGKQKGGFYPVRKNSAYTGNAYKMIVKMSESK